MAELPVTMNGRRPMVVGKFGSREARFILDSGAFHSAVSKATAAEFGLPVKPTPSLYISGVGGESAADVTEPKNFSLAGIALPKADFIVGGSDTGTAGLLGQNILGIADVEYDLPHGVVRLMQTKDCRSTNLAYWAAGRPYTTLPLLVSADGVFRPHTVATVLINGVKVKALFDTGAGSSLLSLAAARRAGVTPQSPGVAPAGYSSGVGSSRVRTWLATFDLIDIGGEAIRRPKIEIGDVTFGNAEMLIGADFFLTHRMFVSNANRLMFVTYEGGPVFGLDPKRAVSDGKVIDLTDTSAEPKDAEGFSRRGAVHLANRRFDLALADFDKACDLAPSEGRHFYQRSLARAMTGRSEDAAGDLNRALELSPGLVDARLLRVRINSEKRDTAATVADLRVLDRDLPPSSDKRFQLAGFFAFLNNPERTLSNYDLWLSSHVEDSSRPVALNGRCWARGLLNQNLDKGLADCNAALKARPDTPTYLDSRALIHLRLGAYAKAIADYDAALRTAPRNAWALYGRSVAAMKFGRTAQAAADRAAALKINPKVLVRARRFGLET